MTDFRSAQVAIDVLTLPDPDFRSAQVAVDVLIPVDMRWWVGDVDTDTNDPANWTGDGSPITSDTILIKDARSAVASTMTDDLDVAQFIIQDSYAGTFTDAGFAVTTSGGTELIADSGSAVLTGDWTVNGGVCALFNVTWGLAGSLTLANDVDFYNTISFPVTLTQTSGTISMPSLSYSGQTFSALGLSADDTLTLAGTIDSSVAAVSQALDIVLDGTIFTGSGSHKLRTNATLGSISQIGIPTGTFTIDQEQNTATIEAGDWRDATIQSTAASATAGFICGAGSLLFADLTLTPGSGWTATFDADTNSPNVSIYGDVTSNGLGTETYTGVATLAGLADQTVDLGANSGMALVVSKPTSGNLTITTAGGLEGRAAGTMELHGTIAATGIIQSDTLLDVRGALTAGAFNIRGNSVSVNTGGSISADKASVGPGTLLVDGALPEYRIPVLTSDGNQYIATGIVPNANTIMKTTQDYTVNGTWQLEGARDAGNDRYYQGVSSGDLWYLGWDTNVAGGAASSGIHTLSINEVAKSLVVDGATKATLTASTLAVINDIHLFAMNDGGTAINHNIAGKQVTRIWQDGVNLSGEFLPAESGSTHGTAGVAPEDCMYDTVTDAYFLNQGTGSFVYSEIANPAFNVETLGQYDRDGLPLIDWAGSTEIEASGELGQSVTPLLTDAYVWNTLNLQASGADDLYIDVATATEFRILGDMFVTELSTGEVFWIPNNEEVIIDGTIDQVIGPIPGVSKGQLKKLIIKNLVGTVTIVDTVFVESYEIIGDVDIVNEGGIDDDGDNLPGGGGGSGTLYVYAVWRNH